ncbi:MAG: hypothetical protein MMC23_002763 [Stictis urceolatum]|nr:hypothetical protein [Stictis urceolata]
MSTPKYIYKILPSTPPPPTPLPLSLPVSTLDRNSGFMHMSTAKQVLGTLKNFFANDDFVYILRVPYERVEKFIQWDAPDEKNCGPRPDEGAFPHIYNGFKLGREEVDVVGRWERGQGWENGGGELEGWDKRDMIG